MGLKIAVRKGYSWGKAQKLQTKIKYSFANANGRLNKLNAEIVQALISAKFATFPATTN